MVNTAYHERYLRWQEKLTQLPSQIRREIALEIRANLTYDSITDAYQNSLIPEAETFDDLDNMKF